MSTYAPVYKLHRSQRSIFAPKDKTERKRKRAVDDTGDAQTSVEASSEAPSEDGPRLLHPVDKKDPYYVAGLSRNESLPVGSFPHTPLRETKKSPTSVTEELSRLNPPLPLPPTGREDHQPSLRRRHVDNLTAILHTRMAAGDWKRAARAWALLLRTEIQGHGVDVRQNGRWQIGAELLMRQDQFQEHQSLQSRRGGIKPTDRNNFELDTDRDTVLTPVIRDDGFKLAKEYYERLILQYPHTARTQHFAVNALVVYPALFSVWIFEVQERSKRARLRQFPPSGIISPDENIAAHTPDQTWEYLQIRTGELNGALPIIQRLEELLLNPPYDTSPALLRLKGMAGLWASDLHSELVDLYSAVVNHTSDDDDGPGADPDDFSTKLRQHRTGAREERTKARRVLEKLSAMAIDLPPDITSLLKEQDGRDMEHDTDD